MHKIKKFQNPSSGLSWNLPGNSTEKDLNNYLQKFTKGLVPGKPYKPSQTFGESLKGGLKSFGTQMKTDTLELAPQLAESALGVFGVKKADVMSGGEQFFSKGTDLAFKAGLKSGNPIAMGIGAGLKGLDLINQFGGKTAKKQGTIGLETGPYDFKTSSLAGQKFTLLGNSKRKKVNALTQRLDTENLMAGNVSYKAQQENLASGNAWNDIASANQQRLIGGLNTRVLSVKKGGNINPALLRNITKKVKVQKLDNSTDVGKFENGGKLNVIPDGALHARLHHLDGELGEAVTGKGIPVVTFDEGGEITQHAEIEVNEIIFNKDTTDKLERYFKLYNKADSDQEKNRIATECGKFLSEEILENTDDRTGLIEEVE